MPRKGQTTEPNQEDEIPKVNAARTRKRKADVATHLQDLDEEVIEMTKKKQCGSQACWNPDIAYTESYKRIPTPDDEVEEPVTAGDLGFAEYHFRNILVTPTRASPLPLLHWASKDEVWHNLLKKDETYSHDTRLMDRHPNLQPKMRAILLDWLMEVCEVYKLHRETFYLARDYFDRFMATQTGVLKTTLQLIGISSLFIAAKMEEIYPPKLHQFSYVTDGACLDEEILTMEIIIMKELNWSLSPMTPVSWLNVYMQVAYLKTEEVLIPQYPEATFVQITELLDLCTLDINSLEFSSGLLAASALFHFSSLELVKKVSGLEWTDLETCVRWMVPFAMAIREMGSSGLKHFKGVSPDNMHNIQTHAPYLEWLNKAVMYHLAEVERSQKSPVPFGVLTPPPSSEKPDGVTP